MVEEENYSAFKSIGDTLDDIFPKRVERRENLLEAEAAEADAKGAYDEFEFKNPYANLSNPYAHLKADTTNYYEDLTVNQLEADRQQSMQAQQTANTLQGLKAAAGGGAGVAGLAQQMAQQSEQFQQKAAASIGAQEAANQKLAAKGAAEAASRKAKMDMVKAKGAGDVQMAQARGESDLQTQQFSQIEEQYGIAMGESAGAQQAITDNTNQWIQGVSSGISLLGMVAGSDRKLKKNINKISESPSGLNIYSFEYIDSKFGKGVFQGVMADEVPDYAVVNNGEYDMVNYDMIDVDFKQL